MTPAVPISDPERVLSLAYAPAGARPALAALWALDEQLGQAVQRTENPAVAQMRLTWWHDALRTLRGPPPADPVLRTLRQAEAVNPETLLPLIDGWERLLEPLPLGEDVLLAFADERGATLFEAGARLLGGNLERAREAGRLWALADLAFRISDRASAALALELAPALRGRWPRPERSLGVLAALAARDVRRGLDQPRRQGSPTRVARAMLMGATGL